MVRAILTPGCMSCLHAGSTIVLRWSFDLSQHLCNTNWRRAMLTSRLEGAPIGAPRRLVLINFQIDLMSDYYTVATRHRVNLPARVPHASSRANPGPGPVVPCQGPGPGSESLSKSGGQRSRVRSTLFNFYRAVGQSHWEPQPEAQACVNGLKDALFGTSISTHFLPTSCQQ